jgi:cell wall assembly regulator SMI1
MAYAAAALSEKAPLQEGKAILEATLLRLEHWLARHRRRFLAGLRPGATPPQLEALQASLGMPLPDELRLLLAWHNGQNEGPLGRFEQDWLLLGTEEIAAAKHVLDADAATTNWDRAWIPFLDDDAGDYVCLDTSTAPPPLREFWLGNTTHEIVASSLTAWLQTFVAHLEKGKYAEDPERGTFLRTN